MFPLLPANRMGEESEGRTTEEINRRNIKSSSLFQEKKQKPCTGVLPNRLMKVVVIVITVKYLLNSKGMAPEFFFFWMRRLKEYFFTAWLFFQISYLKAQSMWKRALWLASSLSLSPSSSAHSVGLAKEQIEKSKKTRPGNQRGNYSQRTKQRGFGYGLCCHWSKQRKVSKRATLAKLIISDWKPQRWHQSPVCNKPRVAHHVEHVNDMWLPKTTFFLFVRQRIHI